jgi:hypothetical protein
MHFHAFDPQHPEDLYGRVSSKSNGAGAGTEALSELARDYARALIAKQQQAGQQPDYVYWTDTTGRRISRHMRHAYRNAVLAQPGSLPSPFVAAEAADYERWRRGARKAAGRRVLSDLAKGVRCALPDEYDALKKRFPAIARSLRGRYIDDKGMWG